MANGNGINNGNGAPGGNVYGNGNGIKNGNGSSSVISNGNGFNHNTQLPSRFKSASFWISAAFYLCIALMVISILSYAFFAYRSYLQKKAISELEAKVATYGTQAQKTSERLVLDYKKKIDDFATIVKNHALSSNTLSFIESKTLPNVWFANFDVSEANNAIRLTGEAESMETLSRQVQVFEESNDYIRSITVLSSQVNFGKKVFFALSLVLDPSIFNYKDVPAVAPTTP